MFIYNNPACHALMVGFQTNGSALHRAIERHLVARIGEEVAELLDDGVALAGLREEGRGGGTGFLRQEAAAAAAAAAMIPGRLNENPTLLSPGRRRRRCR